MVEDKSGRGVRRPRTNASATSWNWSVQAYARDFRSLAISNAMAADVELMHTHARHVRLPFELKPTQEVKLLRELIRLPTDKKPDKDPDKKKKRIRCADLPVEMGENGKEICRYICRKAGCENPACTKDHTSSAALAYKAKHQLAY